MAYLSKTEIEYLKNKTNIPMNQRGVIKKRVREKILSLSSAYLDKGMYLLSPEERKKLWITIVNNMDLEITNEWLKDTLKMLESSSDPLNFVGKVQKKLQKNLKKITNTKIIVKEYREISDYDVDKMKEKLINLFHSEKFILRRKIEDDLKFIKQFKNKIELFNEFKKRNVTNLSFFLNVDHKDTLKEFYERGIILSEGVSKKDFIENSMKIVKHKNKIDGKLQTHPFKAKKKYLNEMVRLNPFYRKL